MRKQTDKTDWQISFREGTGVTMTPAYAQWFRDQYAGMTPGKRRALLREKRPGFERMILRVMVERKTDDPILATEWLHEQLKSGAVTVEAQQALVYPMAFWSIFDERRVLAAFERGYWSDEEARHLWRCLGRDDPMPKRIKFPEQLAAEIRKTMRMN